MKKHVPLLSAIALGLAVAMPAYAQQPAAKAPMVKDAEAVMNLVKVTAIVQAVDQKNRIVTMSASGGATSLFIDWFGPGGGVGPGFHGVGVGGRGVGWR